MPKVSRRAFLTGLGAAGAAGLAGKKLVRAINPEQLTFLPRIMRPHQQERLNVITIMADSIRYDHVGFHGNDWIHTPNIDAFAAESIVFDRAYSGGFPTVLNRAELMTGRYMYTRMGWEDMPQGETVLAQLLNDANYTTGIVFDTPHYKNGNFTLNRGFRSWEWVRGQAEDNWKPTPINPPLPADPSKFRDGAEVVSQYLRNMHGRQSEEDYLVARTVNTAIEWLRDVRGQNNFYLHVDLFDPHEPWDPPQHYIDLYNPGYSGEQVIYPAYAPPNYLSQAELQHVRALYRAELTMVDHWVGKLLAEIDALGLGNNTAVILFSDHGFLLGEHDALGKSWDHAGTFRAYPLYEELIHVPLMVRVPGRSPRRTSHLAQPGDVMPTVLELMDVNVPGAVEAASLLPIIEDDSPVHDFVVSSRSIRPPFGGDPTISVGDGRWFLHHGGNHTASALYDVESDPTQQNNVLAGNCDIARNLHSRLIDFLESLDLPEETIAPWRPTPC